MPKTEFKIGDVVTLRTGGPRMIVFCTETDGPEMEVHCKWSLDGVELQRSFPVNILVLHGPIPQ